MNRSMRRAPQDRQRDNHLLRVVTALPWSKETWQRGLVIEYAPIASFVAFTLIHFLFVVGIKAS